MRNGTIVTLRRNKTSICRLCRKELKKGDRVRAFQGKVGRVKHECADHPYPRESHIRRAGQGETRTTTKITHHKSSETCYNWLGADYIGRCKKHNINQGGYRGRVLKLRMLQEQLNNIKPNNLQLVPIQGAKPIERT